MLSTKIKTNRFDIIKQLLFLGRTFSPLVFISRVFVLVSPALTLMRPDALDYDVVYRARIIHLIRHMLVKSALSRWGLT